MLRKIVARLAEDRLMSGLLGQTGDFSEDPRTTDTSERLRALGRAQGVVHDDVSLADIQVLVSGFAQVLLHQDVRDPDVWQHDAPLVLRGLRS